MKVLLVPVVTALTLFIVFNTASTQVLTPGVCPNYTAVQNFSVASYLGAWYEIERTFTWFSINATCVKANYSDFGNGSVRVENTQINGLGEPESIVGSATPENPNSTEAKLIVNFPFTGSVDAPYWVVDTDYSNYSVVWSCRNLGNNSFQTLWFLSRDRNPSQSLRDYVHGFLTGLSFDLGRLTETPQANCTL